MQDYIMSFTRRISAKNQVIFPGLYLIAIFSHILRAVHPASPPTPFATLVDYNEPFPSSSLSLIIALTLTDFDR